MSETNIKYAAASAIAWSPASLASSATFIAGREGTVIDNGTTKYVDIELSGVVRVGTTPTINTQILIFAFGLRQPDTPTYPDQMTGADAARSVTSVGVGQGFLRLVAALNVDATTSNRDYDFAGVSLLPLFGGTLPKKIGLYLAHNTGVALNATGGQHVFTMQGVTYTIT